MTKTKICELISGACRLAYIAIILRVPILFVGFDNNLRSRVQLVTFRMTNTKSFYHPDAIKHNMERRDDLILCAYICTEGQITSSRRCRSYPTCTVQYFSSQVV